MSIDALTFLNVSMMLSSLSVLSVGWKMSSMWLLDSGASAHFTYNKNDFIEYMPFSESERLLVRTTAHKIFVEGTGTLLQ